MRKEVEQAILNGIVRAHYGGERRIKAAIKSNFSLERAAEMKQFLDRHRDDSALQIKLGRAVQDGASIERLLEIVDRECGR